MQLEMMTPADVEIRIRAETDPAMMTELGGPRPRADIERAHARSMLMAAEGTSWPLKIIVDGEAAGNVMVWESEHDGETISEIGWLTLPEFQGRGLATAAVREVLAKARAERKFGQIHAFPSVTNVASNRVCEKNGFTNLGECAVEFAGKTFRCYHWRIEVFSSPGEPGTS
jgi:RimJ/RimL family protein N-acetyltransferase